MTIPSTHSNYLKYLVFCISCILFACGNDDPAPEVTHVEIISMSPESPADLKYYKTGSQDRVEIKFRYVVTEEEGVRIFIQAQESQSYTGTGYYSPSPVYKATGEKTNMISVESDEEQVVFNKLRIRIRSADNSTLLSEEFVDVNYTFSE